MPCHICPVIYALLLQRAQRRRHQRIMVNLRCQIWRRGDIVGCGSGFASIELSIDSRRHWQASLLILTCVHRQTSNIVTDGCPLDHYYMYATGLILVTWKYYHNMPASEQAHLNLSLVSTIGYSWQHGYFRRREVSIMLACIYKQRQSSVSRL